MTVTERNDLAEFKVEVQRQFAEVKEGQRRLATDVTDLFRDGPISKLQIDMEVLRTEFTGWKDLQRCPTPESKADIPELEGRGKWLFLARLAPWFGGALLVLGSDFLREIIKKLAGMVTK
jgi:hypothetical protein